jgi:hypothetical protein
LVADLPTTLSVTISSVSSGGVAVCSCFKGTFALTKDAAGDWSSGPIAGCVPTGYIKLRADANAFGITNQTSSPGSGASSLFSMTGSICPLNLTGGSIAAGSWSCADGGISNLTFTITK